MPCGLNIIASQASINKKMSTIYFLVCPRVYCLTTYFVLLPLYVAGENGNGFQPFACRLTTRREIEDKPIEDNHGCFCSHYERTLLLAHDMHAAWYKYQVS